MVRSALGKDKAGAGMFDRFTDRAKKVMKLAQKEAKRYQHDFVGTEHILLGLVEEGSGVAANVLKALGVGLKQVREEIESRVQPGLSSPVAVPLPLTRRANLVVLLSKKEAEKLGHSYLGTEHLLLGLLRERDGVAAQILLDLGLELDEVRRSVLELLGGAQEPEPPLKSPCPWGTLYGAKNVMAGARREAQRFHHGSIAPEHIFLGLLLEEGGIASKVFTRLGVDIERIRGELDHSARYGNSVHRGGLPLTPRAKSLLDRSKEEATALGGKAIGSAHLLLALLREEYCLPTEVLVDFGLDLEAVRQCVFEVLGVDPGNAQALAQSQREPETESLWSSLWLKIRRWLSAR